MNADHHAFVGLQAGNAVSAGAHGRNVALAARVNTQHASMLAEYAAITNAVGD